jgi:DNA-binding PadR family transcriptional regulator
MLTMTDAELTILGLVVEQPRHGYEIEQVIEERGMREWTEIGFSSIYYLLKKLEGEGLITGQLQEAQSGPARKVYQATSAGREAYRAAVLDALAVPRRRYSTLLLGLSGLIDVPPAEALAALQRYRAALVERRDNVQTNLARQRPLSGFIDAMFDHSLTMIQAEITWVEEFIAKTEDQHDAQTVGRI